MELLVDLLLYTQINYLKFKVKIPNR